MASIRRFESDVEKFSEFKMLPLFNVLTVWKVVLLMMLDPSSMSYDEIMSVMRSGSRPFTSWSPGLISSDCSLLLKPTVRLRLC